MIFVSHNRHKFEEIRAMFKENGMDLEWMNLEYEEIQGDTTEQISRRSCETLAPMVEGDYFLEDTGLYINALNGFPGPYSSYVVEKIGLEGILRLLQNKDRSAYFLTVVSLRMNGEIEQFRGVSSGTIAFESKGEYGFGYDPVFIPEESDRTLSEMTVAEKNLVSHRARAVNQLIEFLRKL